MESIYENSDIILSTLASDKDSQYKGNTNDQESEKEVSSPKWTKALVIGLAVALVSALGGLCFLGIKYASVSVQLSAQETDGTLMARKLEELTVNYTRATEDLRNNDIKMRELTASLTSAKEKLTVCQEFAAQFSKYNMADFQGKVYFFTCNKLNWQSSREFCVSKGADLVTITSQEEQKFLFSKINSWHWIGLNDLETEGGWVWVNNKTLNETGVQFWHQRKNEPSEPDDWKQQDPSGEDCAYLNNGYDAIDSWFDASCKRELNFICEKKVKHLHE